MQQRQHTHRRLMRGIIFGGLVGGTILIAGAPTLRAQERPAADAVVLEYKYPAGRTQKFRSSATAELMLTPEGGDVGLGAIPITTRVQTVTSEKVVGSRDKTGTLSVKLDSMQLDMEILGQQTTIKSENGKVSATMNGLPVPKDHPLVAQTGGLTELPAVTIQRDAAGRGTTQGDTGAVQLLNNGGLMAHFPEHPVRVGQSWEVEQKVANSIPGPAGAAGSTEMDVRFTHILKEIQVRDGRREAIIESTGVGAIGQAEAGEGADRPAQEQGAAPALKSATQRLSGVSRFDIDRGALVSGTFNMELDAVVAAPAGAAGGGAGGPQSIRLNGGIKINFSELAAPAAKAPAKPAGNKPAAPRRPAPRAR